MVNYRTIESIEDEMKALKEIIEREFKVDDIFTHTRRREYVDARMIYSKILKDRGHSLSAIGRFLKKNHATIIHYISNAEFLIRQEAKLRERYTNSRSMFLENRDPIYRTPTQRDLLNKVISLSNQIEILEAEYKKVNDAERRFRRLKGIINIIDAKLPEGKESFLENKINKILNDIKK